MAASRFGGAGFNPRPIQVGFVLYKVALVQVVLQVLYFSHVTIVPSVLHTHSFIYH